MNYGYTMNQNSGETDKLGYAAKYRSELEVQRRIAASEGMMPKEHSWWTCLACVKHLADELERHGYISRDEREKVIKRPFDYHCEWLWLQKHGTMEGFTGEVLI